MRSAQMTSSDGAGLNHFVRLADFVRVRGTVLWRTLTGRGKADGGVGASGRLVSSGAGKESTSMSTDAGVGISMGTNRSLNSTSPPEGTTLNTEAWPGGGLS